MKCAVSLPHPQVMHICGQCQCVEKMGAKHIKSGKFELAVSGDKKMVIFARVSVISACKAIHHVTIM